MPPLLALAYSPQLIQAVPMEPRDRPVDALATAVGLVSCTEVGGRLVRGE
jgi:5-formyltetrahydrofolate cyclo-ligase